MTHECSMLPEDDEWELIHQAIEEHRLPPWPAMNFHLAPQDTSLPGWNALLQLVEDAASDKRETFSPKKELGAHLWMDVITLPPSISKLKHIKKLDLYGSNLLRIPPEIGQMESLAEFVPYASYGLHWFPYELTCCRNLKSSTVSTRALYGNYKYRPPFPSLEAVVSELIPDHCSVCRGTIESKKLEQVWLSLGIGTDVLPLLVNACSSACVARLPKAAEGYVHAPHQGGQSVTQPLADD